MSRISLTDLAADPRLRAVIIQHARRGLRAQVGLRGVLVVFALCTASFVPPAHHRQWLFLAAGLYLVAAALTVPWLARGAVSAVRYGWLALFGDVAALVILTLIAALSARESWTADVMINGFFAIPLLAATQLRPGVCLSVVVPTVVAYLAVGFATAHANGDEPLASIVLRTLAIAGLGAGCVALSWIQRSRVVTIGALVQAREQLLTELLDIEGRERRQLAEHLHDGALQYVLAARMDVEDARDGTDPDAFDRIDAALGQTSTLLRNTVGELYPAVLDQAGLPEALRQIASAAAARGGFAVSVQDATWPAASRTANDQLLFSTARELLANVVKHAQARTVAVEVGLSADETSLRVRDDGTGVDPDELDRKLAAGHIGVASHRARVEAAGGTLQYAPVAGGGTVATVRVPIRPDDQLVTSLPENRAQDSATNTAR